MKKIFILINCFILLNFISFLYAQAQVGTSGYRIINKFPVEGNAGWDYLCVDEATFRLFVSHGNIVQVVDERTGNLIGTIPDTIGVHGIALVQTLNKGFTSNGKDDSVTVFSLDKLETLTKIPITGHNPDAIIYDKFSKYVFVFNGRSTNATVIDTKDNKIVSTIKLDGKPEYPVSDGKGNIYVNIEDKSLIDVINTQSLKVVKNWSLAPGEEPSGLAMDRENHRLFSVCNNKLMVIMNAKNGKIITTLPIGEHVDGAAFDPNLKRAYSSNGEGTITVVQEISDNEFKVLENVPTQKGARTITVDTFTGHLYLPTAEYGPTPNPTPEHPKPRPPIKVDSFMILDVAPVK